MLSPGRGLIHSSYVVVHSPPAGATIGLKRTAYDSGEGFCNEPRTAELSCCVQK